MDPTPIPAASTGETPDRIAAWALRSFTTKGFAATTVREIAAAVGLTVPAIYYHFDSKDGLLAALVQPFVDDGETVLEALRAEPPNRRQDRALGSYYDILVRNLDVFRFVMADPSVRSHDLAGHRLAHQGAEFLTVLMAPSSDRAAWVRANAALGAIRRPLRLREVDPVGDRAQILASARAALRARP
jgi:AcrR family transcriptional regulator